MLSVVQKMLTLNSCYKGWITANIRKTTGVAAHLELFLLHEAFHVILDETAPGRVGQALGGFVVSAPGRSPAVSSENKQTSIHNRRAAARITE